VQNWEGNAVPLEHLPLTQEKIRPVWSGAPVDVAPRKPNVIAQSLPSEFEVARVVRTVLVVDVVESVRLMQDDEAGTIRRWRSFVDHVSHELLAGREGRLAPVEREELAPAPLRHPPDLEDLSVR